MQIDSTLLTRRIASAGLAIASLATSAHAADLGPPVSPLADAGVTPFVIAADDESRTRALRCLTEAVYYEAATEPREGQEAVAQVVLNRMRRAGFPKSVCGVVFEGSERRTGCQFTFTCDGSLARRPIAWRWDVAEEVANAALNGYVARSVGSATHYHAAWMTPYWSSSLVRAGQIGHHVFYRSPGELGRPDALTGLYTGQEPETVAAPAPSSGATASANPSRRQTARPSSTEFSVWGLKVATLSSRRGQLVVRNDLNPQD